MGVAVHTLVMVVVMAVLEITSLVRAKVLVVAELADILAMAVMVVQVRAQVLVAVVVAELQVLETNLFKQEQAVVAWD
jgi:hypothetical protein